MRLAKSWMLGALLVASAAAVGYALEAANGSTVSLVFTAPEAQSGATYDAGFSGERWQDLADFALWNPIGPGQRDGLAADAAGDVFVMVYGREFSDPTSPEYTGLLRYDGSTFRHLVQDRMSSGLYLSRTGTELQAVVASPTSTGLLTAGHPVVLRHVITVAGGTQLDVDLVSVDPSTGAETLLHRFGLDAHSARVAIDGSGGASDGVIYVGPVAGGALARLTYSGGAYSKTTVPGTFGASSGLVIDADGDLYTFASGATWLTLISPYDDQTIYRVDPSTGAATSFAAVDGESFIFDWVWGSDARLWMGLRWKGKSGKKNGPVRYVAEAPAGGVAARDARICDSTADPSSLAAAPGGGVYLLERPFRVDGAVYLVTPGSGGGGNGNGNGNGNGKGKNK